MFLATAIACADDDRECDVESRTTYAEAIVAKARAHQIL